MKIIFVAILGWVAGVTVNYISDSLPITRRLGAPICQNCHQNFPLINYFLWPRTCPNCGRKRKFRTWVVELIFVMIAVSLWLYPPENLGFLFGFLLLLYFAVVIIIDLEYRLILHPVSIFGAFLAMGYGIWLHGLLATILGGLAGYGIMLGLYFLGIGLMRVLSRVRNEEMPEEALGFGDVNLSGVIGLLLGWPGVVGGLIVAILLGGVISLIYILFLLAFRQYQSGRAIPYGPFLVGGAVFLLYFRDLIF